jgi:hypothetical protein
MAVLLARDEVKARLRKGPGLCFYREAIIQGWTMRSLILVRAVVVGLIQITFALAGDADADDGPDPRVLPTLMQGESIPPAVC